MDSKKLLLAVSLVICLVATAAVVAQDDGCGTVVPQAMIDYDLERLASGWDYSQLAEPSMAATTVPLAIHIVRTTAGTGGLSAADLTQAMTDLDMQYVPMNITFCIKGAVDYIDSDSYYYNTNQSFEWDSLRTTNVVDSAINVYFIPNVSGFPWCGLSSFTSSTVQGIIMLNGCSGSGSQATLSHEIGHYFDLYHTHETAFGVECPNGSNCPTAGDLLCDTPADPQLQTGTGWHVSNWPACVYDNYATTPAGCGGTYNPQTDNLMSYSQHRCRDFFSDQQIAKAVNVLNTLRTELLGGGCGGTPTMLVSPSSLTQSLPLGGSASQTLTITNTGTGNLNYVISHTEVPKWLEVPGNPAVYATRSMTVDASGSEMTDEPTLLGETIRTFGTADAALSSVMILYATSATPDPGVDSMAAQLSAYADIGSVTTFNCYAASPSVAQLSSNDVVIMGSRFPFSDMPTASENVALYLDGGGKLVLVVFSWHGGAGYTIEGRLLTDYSPFQTSGSTLYAWANIGSVVSGHPLFAGVSSLSAYFRDNVSLSTGAGLLGTWDDAHLMAAQKGNVIGLNFAAQIPAGTNTNGWSGDGWILVHNAVAHLTAPSWLSYVPITGTVPPGGSDAVSVNFDAAGLAAGSYNADLFVAGNDPATPSVMVPVHLAVGGTPTINVIPLSLDETLPPNNTSTQAMLIANTGTGNLFYGISVTDLTPAPVESNGPLTVIPQSELEKAVIAARDEFMNAAPSVSSSDMPDNYIATAPQLRATGPMTAGDARIGNLLHPAIEVASFPNYSVAAVPLSIAFDGVYYYVTGGGFSSGVIAKQAADFTLVDTQTVMIDARSIMHNASDGQVYIKSYSWNALFRLHTSPFDGSFDTVFTNIFQNDQSKACFSPDGMYMFDNLDGKVRKYDFATGTAVDSFNLALPHDNALPRGWQLSHTGTYLLTQANNTVFAYDPTTGAYVDSSFLPGGYLFEEWSSAYANGLLFMCDNTYSTWYAYRIDDGAGGGLPWLYANMYTGIVPPGAGDTIMWTFNSTGLTPGDYNADIAISNNDPVTPSVNVPAHLAVGGAACISVVPDSLDEMLPVGDTSHQGMTISNCGTGDLNYLITHNEILKTLTVPEEPAVYAAKSIGENVSGSEATDAISVRQGEVLRSFGAADAALPSVLILNSYSGSNPGVDSMVVRLSAYPNVGSVAVFNCFAATPSVAQLSGYDVLILTANYVYMDIAATCENVSLYLDGGGKVILLGLTWYGPPFGIQDRLLTDYSPFQIAGASLYATASIGSVVSGHPIFTGVSSLTALMRDNVSLSTSASLLGTWDDGHLMVAEKGNVVGLNYAAQEPSTTNSDGWTGDGWIMLHNAVSYLTTPSWLSYEPSAGTIPPGGSQPVDVRFDATGLTPGDYNADIAISSNDPVTPTVNVPAHLLVGGTPIISVVPGSLDQTLLPGGSASQTMTVSNSGTGALNYAIHHNELPKSLPVPEHPLTQPNDIGLVGTGDTPDIDVISSPQRDPVTYGKSSAATIDVLLMGSSGATMYREDTLAGRLISYPDVGAVTVFDCTAGTPTLAQMQSYDLVLMTTNHAYMNMTLASETVAQYLDGGGKVVISTFGWADQLDNTINGRLLTDYSPFQVAGTSLYLTANLGSTVAGHPLFGGVAALTGHYRDNVTLSSGAGLLGTWDDSHLLAAQKGNVLGINLAVYSSYITDPALDGWTGDGYTLVHNAVIYMTSDSWLSYVPITGTVPPGGSDAVSVNFDATGHAIGDYFANMFVTSNDPVTPSVLVPAHLRVGGTPIISVSPSDSLVDTLLVGDTSMHSMTISNSGTGDLNYLIVHNEILKSLPVPDLPAATTSENVYTGMSNPATVSEAIRPRQSVQSYGASNSLATSVLIMHSNGAAIMAAIDSLVANLSAYPDIGSVGVFDCKTGTPPMGLLAAYDVIIMTSDQDYMDMAQASDNVAGILFAGGKVIMTSFAWSNQGSNTIMGGLLADYSPFQIAGGALYAMASMGSIVSGHPLFNGVDSLASTYRDGVTLSGAAVLLGTWSDTHLMVAEKGNVIGLNFAVTGPENVVVGGWTGDGWTLLHNAVAYLTSPSWLSYAPSAGTIPPGGSQPVGVRLDASGLSIGDYNAMMHVTSNDPVSPDVTLPVHMVVRESCCLNRGDMDHSGGAVPVDISDLTLFSDYMFLGGRPPVCMDEADANSDGAPDITDLTFIVDFMFHGGAAPGPCF